MDDFAILPESTSRGMASGRCFHSPRTSGHSLCRVSLSFLRSSFCQFPGTCSGSTQNHHTAEGWLAVIAQSKQPGSDRPYVSGVDTVEGDFTGAQRKSKPLSAACPIIGHVRLWPRPAVRMVLKLQAWSSPRRSASHSRSTHLAVGLTLPSP